MVSRRDKRSVDLQIIADWVEPGSRVLDLGCGRGILLELLTQERNVRGVGVDINGDKIIRAIRRGLSVYQGDLELFLKSFPDDFFDRVICSRTVQELARPAAVIREALRVSRRMTVGFINHAYWRNRISLAVRGARLINEVYPEPWEESRPSNPVSVSDFVGFCRREGISIKRAVHLRGDWKTPCRRFVSWRCGYAIYDLSRGKPAIPAAGAAR
ncbi:MAG: methyltransferase domain-containing protein [Puniceicoccaceae bacterium]|nr:MAG: methyltransferase domain-containing protein [Puniceicoccaceae bacterium]